MARAGHERRGWKSFLDYAYTADKGLSMADWEAKVAGLKELRAKLITAAQRMPQTVKQVLFKRLTQAVEHARANYLTGGTTDTRLAVRTGALRASFGFEMQGTGAEISARIGYILPQRSASGGDPLVYARIHEGWPDGRNATTIHPRNAKYLAIPLDAAKTPAGVARGRPRDFVNTFVRKSKAGNLVIFQKTGNGGIQPLFVLKTAVTIPARPALRPTMNTFVPLILRDLGEAVVKTVG